MSEKRIINVYCIDKICTFYGKMNDVEINLRKKQVTSGGYIIRFG